MKKKILGIMICSVFFFTSCSTTALAIGGTVVTGIALDKLYQEKQEKKEKQEEEKEKQEVILKNKEEQTLYADALDKKTEEACKTYLDKYENNKINDKDFEQISDLYQSIIDSNAEIESKNFIAAEDNYFSAIPENVQNSNVYYSEQNEFVGGTVKEAFMSYKFKPATKNDDGSESGFAYDKAECISPSEYIIPISLKTNNVSNATVKFYIKYFSADNISILEKVSVYKANDKSTVAESDKIGIEQIMLMLSNY